MFEKNPGLYGNIRTKYILSFSLIYFKVNYDTTKLINLNEQLKKKTISLKMAEVKLAESGIRPGMAKSDIIYLSICFSVYRRLTCVYGFT